MKLALLISGGEHAIGPVNDHTHFLEIQDDQVVLTSSAEISPDVDRLMVSTVFDPIHNGGIPRPGARPRTRSAIAAVALRNLVQQHDETLTYSVAEYQRVGPEGYEKLRQPLEWSPE